MASEAGVNADVADAIAGNRLGLLSAGPTSARQRPCWAHQKNWFPLLLARTSRYRVGRLSHFRLGRTWLHYAFGGPIGVYVWELAVRIQLLRATSRGELALIGLAGSLLLAAHMNQLQPTLIYSGPHAKCRWLKIWRKIEDF